MSNYKLVTIDQRFIAETISQTGSEELLEKASRNFVGLYDTEENWYIPLRANISKNRPSDAYFLTPFKTDNPHFKRPGLDFQKALFVPDNRIIELEDRLPKAQSIFINEKKDEIESKFESYVESIEYLPVKSAAYTMSTVPLFPEGIAKIKALIAERQFYSLDEEMNDIMLDGHGEFVGELEEGIDLEDLDFTDDDVLEEIDLDSLPDRNLAALTYNALDAVLGWSVSNLFEESKTANRIYDKLQQAWHIRDVDAPTHVLSFEPSEKLLEFREQLFRFVEFGEDLPRVPNLGQTAFNMELIQTYQIPADLVKEVHAETSQGNWLLYLLNDDKFKGRWDEPWAQEAAENLYEDGIATWAREYQLYGEPELSTDPISAVEEGMEELEEIEALPENGRHKL